MQVQLQESGEAQAGGSLRLSCTASGYTGVVGWFRQAPGKEREGVAMVSGIGAAGTYTLSRLPRGPIHHLPRQRQEHGVPKTTPICKTTNLRTRPSITVRQILLPCVGLLPGNINGYDYWGQGTQVTVSS
nr:immunoglobulin heavy chain variable region [Camelus dromedarius]